MALSIKTAEADRLARELAAVTHESLTEAVTVALRERLERLRRSAPENGLARIQAWVATLPVADPRTPDEIIGYDDRGLPA